MPKRITFYLRTGATIECVADDITLRVTMAGTLQGFCLEGASREHVRPLYVDPSEVVAVTLENEGEDRAEADPAPSGRGAGGWAAPSWQRSRQPRRQP